MKPRVHVLLAFSAILLITAFCTGASWAQTKIARVGILNNSPNMRFLIDFLSAMHFYQTLGEHGWVEGKNVAFEYRDPGIDPTRMAEPAAELVGLKVDVLFPIGPPSVRAAFAAAAVRQATISIRSRAVVPGSAVEFCS